MRNPWGTLRPRDEFKKLQAEWYGRLKQEGFEDIEKGEKWFQGRRSGQLPKSYRGTWKNNPRYSLNARYYELASQLLFSHPFESEVRREIWGLHCKGIPERAIADQIKVYKKSMVHYIIASYARLIRWKS
jgi:hypothetical protein